MTKSFLVYNTVLAVMPAPHEPCSDRYSQINWMEDIEPTIAYNDQLAYEDYLSPDGDCVSTDIRRETDSTNNALVYYNHGMISVEFRG